ncbi:unnamed protein product [Phaeothamnion confervicola]
MAAPAAAAAAGSGKGGASGGAAVASGIAAAARRVRIGYHSIPSLQPLHVHIVSQDLDSPSLKNKKHWNTFSTPFFLEADAVEAVLAGPTGAVAVDERRCRQMKAQPLRCFRCRAAQRNMPALKEHNLRCKAPVPEHLPP